MRYKLFAKIIFFPSHNLKMLNKFTRTGLFNNLPLFIFFFSQLRQSVRKFCSEKLAPYADDIDKNNAFPEMRVSLQEWGHRVWDGRTLKAEENG